MTSKRLSSFLTPIAFLFVTGQQSGLAQSYPTFALTITAADHEKANPRSLSVNGSPRIGAKPLAALPGAAQQPLLPLPATGYYPFDVGNPDHPVYVNNPVSHWGDPAGFLTDLGASDYIHTIDQYTGSTANHRYTLDFLQPEPFRAGQQDADFRRHREHRSRCRRESRKRIRSHLPRVPATRRGCVLESGSLLLPGQPLYVLCLLLLGPCDLQ